MHGRKPSGLGMGKVSIGLGRVGSSPHTENLRLQQNFHINPFSSNLNRNCVNLDCTQL